VCNRKYIAVSAPDLSASERTALLNAFDSSWISSKGSFVTQFEEEFASFVGTRHAISCTNGTSALHLALLSLGISAGDEVIIPDLTYIATANAVRYVDAEPVFADCDPHTWNVNPASVRRMLSPRTKAIVGVHLLGVPANASALRAIADETGCALVEDAAETPGAKWEGIGVGSWGDVGTFSFYGNKMITTGEGGAVCTNNDALANRLRKLRGQAADPHRHYWFDEVGYNYRMTNLACAIGVAQLARYPEIAEKRRAVRSWYEESFAEARLRATLQQCPPQAYPAWWMIGTELDSMPPADREATRRILEARRIETRPFFSAISSLPIYKGCRTDEGCPIAQHLGRNGVMLPTHSKLGRDDVHRIVVDLAAALKETVQTR